MTTQLVDGNAVVFCQGAFTTGFGKTAHGLVRRTDRYHVVAVIDAQCAGRDAGEVLDGKTVGIPIVSTLEEARRVGESTGKPLSHFVIGLAPIGGRLTGAYRDAVRDAIGTGLNVDSGLHDFLSEDPELSSLASLRGVKLRDVRKPPARSELHAYTGRIDEVGATRIACLGTDSACGKRTTAWKLVEGLRAAGRKAEMIGTGQTAWMQGAKWSLRLDALVNDFVAGELEHAVLECWREVRPDFIVVEGQGAMMSPCAPGGLEILASTRPQLVVLQHPVARKGYDGAESVAIHPLEDQIQVIELIAGKGAVAALTLNHEGLRPEEIPAIARELEHRLDRPVTDVLLEGSKKLVDAVLRREKAR